MSAAGRSRSAAIALLAGVIAIAGAAVLVPAALRWTQDGQIIRTERLKILRAGQRRDARESLIATRAAWDGFVQSDRSGFILASTDDIAIAETRTRIEAAFARLGGAATGIAAETGPASRKGVTKIAVEVRGTIPRSSLAALLAALESESPYMIIDRFEAETAPKDELAIGLGGGVFRLSGAGA